MAKKSQDSCIISAVLLASVLQCFFICDLLWVSWMEVGGMHATFPVPFHSQHHSTPSWQVPSSSLVSWLDSESVNLQTGVQWGKDCPMWNWTQSSWPQPKVSWTFFFFFNIRSLLAKSVLHGYDLLFSRSVMFSFLACGWDKWRTAYLRGSMPDPGHRAQDSPWVQEFWW